MKKLFTLIIAGMALSTAANAQRSVDLSVDSIYSPTELQSGASGTSWIVNLNLKNNGPDQILTGDTIYMGFHIANLQGQVILGYPTQNPSQVAVAATATKDYAMGDTLHVVMPLSANGVTVNLSGYVAIQGSAYVRNRTDGMDFEGQSTNTNNSKLNIITWYNQGRWPVSVGQESADLLSIYPNPTTGFVTINFNLVDVENSTVLNVYDMKGQLVHTATSNPMEGEIALNTSGWNNGMYVVEMKAGQLTKKAKLVVSH